MGLITSSRAKQAINQSSFTAGEDTQISSLIETVSTQVKRYCRQDFASTSYDELYSGAGSWWLLLSHYPLVSVSRVAADPTAVLVVQNTSASVQRATVQVTATGLTLVHVASGTSTSTSLTFAGNATLSALATAVNAVGSGWGATVTAGYENWASADLRALQGAQSAKGAGARPVIHVTDLGDFEVDGPRGILLRGCGGWARGVDNYRVVYTAGWSSVPEDVQEACAQWVAAHFWMTRDNPASYPPLPTETVLALLGPYRRHVL